MKFATFDLETVGTFENHEDPRTKDLGISCAALGLSDQPEPRYFQGNPRMTRAECSEMVRILQQVQADGYTLVTWNGTAFDFPILAEDSGLARECADIALSHVDLMVIVTFKRGHYLGLQKALDGAGIPGKLKEVTLKDGSVRQDITGKDAPALWEQGEKDAVLAYLREDVMPLLELTALIQRKKQIQWTSVKGVPNTVAIEKLYTVRECFDFPMPDTSWMKLDPPQRAKFVEWMPPLDEKFANYPSPPRQMRERADTRPLVGDEYFRQFRIALH